MTHAFPVDYRIYDKEGDDLSKNDHFRAMLQTAFERGFQPYVVIFDSWYSGIDNLKFINRFEWYWFSRVKKNRMVNPDKTGNRPVSSISIPDDGIVVHLKKYGFIRLLHSVNKIGKDRYWVSNYLNMDYQDRKNLQAIWLSDISYG